MPRAAASVSDLPAASGTPGELVAAAPAQAQARAELLSNLGLALRRQGRLAEAASSIMRALAHAPRSSEMLAMLGRVREEQGRQEESRELYAVAVAVEIGDVLM